MPKHTRERPAWLREAAGEDARSADQPATTREGIAARDDADTSEMPVVEPPASGHRHKEGSAQESGTLEAALESASTGDASSEGARAAGGVRPTPQRLAGSPGGLREWLRDNLLTGWRAVALAVAAALILLLIVVLWPFGGSSGQADSPSAEGGASPASPPIEDTGAVFDSLHTRDGQATLQGAGLSWEGEVEEGEAGRTINLRGPTAVQIRQGFDMPRSSITSGVFAVAQEGGAVLHVSFHTFESGDTEVTQGSIFAVEDDSLRFAGYYRDEREAGSEKVVRTYMHPDGENYRVSFEAPKGTPVPLLVGFRETS